MRCIVKKKGQKVKSKEERKKVADQLQKDLTGKEDTKRVVGVGKEVVVERDIINIEVRILIKDIIDTINTRKGMIIISKFIIGEDIHQVVKVKVLVHLVLQSQDQDQNLRERIN